MEDKKEYILTESYQLFRKYGVRSLSMDDIARELGISKKTLYQHFENKSDLMSKILYKLVHSEEYSCAPPRLDELNAIDVLLEVSRQVSEQMNNLNPAIVFDLQKYYPKVFSLFVSTKRDHALREIIKNFRQGIEEGIYRDDLDVELVARLYVKKLEDSHDAEFLKAINFSFDKVFEVMFDSHIRGIANAKGIAYYEEKIKNNLNLTTA